MKIFISLIAVLVFSIVAFAQPGNNWQGSDVPGHTFASFQNLNNKQGFDIRVPEKSRAINLKYVVSRKEGDLKLVIRSAKETVLEKTITETAKDSLLINRKAGEKYRIYIIGKKAAGSFDITYSGS